MRGARQLGILAAVTIGAGVLMGGPAAADEVPEDAAIASVTEEVVVSRETTMAGTTATGVPATKCRTYETTKTAKNVFGSTQFKFHQKISWCYNGTKITSVTSSKAWADSIAVGWRYHGVQSTDTSGGTGKTSYTAWRQGKFCLTVPGTGAGCVSEKRPWIEQKVTRTGGASSSSGI